MNKLAIWMKTLVNDYIDEVDIFVKKYSYLDVHLFGKWRKLKEYVAEVRQNSKESRRIISKLERKMQRG